MGCVYKRSSSGSWFIQYYDPSIGKTRKECTGSKNYRDAIRLLRQREATKDRGEPIIPRVEKITVGELLNMLELDYRIKGNRSLCHMKDRVAKHLRPFFGMLRAGSLTFEHLQKYRCTRQDSGAKVSTINREFAHLRRALRLGIRSRKIQTMPQFELPNENNTREGFFEVEEFLKLLPHLPRWLRPIAEFGYATGWRRNEIITLKWNEVDRLNSVITLRPELNKSKRVRHFHYPQNEYLQNLIQEQWRRRNEIQKAGGRDVSYVFFHNDGRKISSFVESWRTACKKAGLSGKLFHDLRRTSVRNMVRAGINERVAMSISGHLTRSIFDRYNIVSPKDQQEASAKLGIEYQIQQQHFKIDPNFDPNLQKPVDLNLEKPETYSVVSTRKL